MHEHYAEEVGHDFHKMRVKISRTIGNALFFTDSVVWTSMRGCTLLSMGDAM